MLCRGNLALPTKFERVLSGFGWSKHSFQRVQDSKHTIVLSSLSDVPPRVTHTQHGCFFYLRKVARNGICVASKIAMLPPSATCWPHKKCKLGSSWAKKCTGRQQWTQTRLEYTVNKSTPLGGALVSFQTFEPWFSLQFSLESRCIFELVHHILQSFANVLLNCADFQGGWSVFNFGPD